MSLEFLKNDIAEKSFRKIYLITGNEPYLKEHWLSALKKAVLPEGNDFDLITADGKDLSTEEFTENVRSLPLVSAKKLYIITDLPISSPVVSLLSKEEGLLSDEMCLVIYCDVEKYDKRTAEYKAFEKFVKANGLSVVCDTPEEKDLVRWVSGYFSKHGFSISRQVAEYFVKNIPADMFLLKNEADKLIFYKEEEKTVSQEDIDLLSTKSYDAKSYEMTNAIFSKNCDAAYDICKKMLAMNTYPLILLYSIENAVATIAKTRILLEEKKTQSEIGKIMGTKEYPTQKNCEIARRLSNEQINALLECCIAADISSKSTAVSMEDSVYRLIAECVSKL